MQTINLCEAKAQLPKLIEQIATGAESEFVITRNGKPVARVVPVAKTEISQRIGIAKGEFTVPGDIDQNNAEVAHLFLGGNSDDAPSA